jgi:hypothetical protein
MTATETMIDAIRVNARNIPPGCLKVAGYGTGTGDVPWTPAEWALFPKAGHVRIDQTPGLNLFATGGADVADIEAYAGTVSSFVAAVKERIAHGVEWSTAYGSDSTLLTVHNELEAAGPHGWYFGHVDCWLADWNLSEAQAAALVGREVHGMTCRAVQWASPSSNPSTIVPGGTLTLAAANVDLSAAEASWHAPLTVTPPPKPALDGYLVSAGGAGGFAGRAVTSADGGKTWS